MIYGWKVKKSDNYLMHYGIPRRSGRYPYGSGERPYQGEERSKMVSDSEHMSSMLKQKGFSIKSKINPYNGKYEYTASKLIKTKDGLGREISADLDVTFEDVNFTKYGKSISENDLSSAIDNMTSNFSKVDREVRKYAAEKLVKDNTPWNYEDSGMTKSQMKEQLIKDIGIGFDGKPSKLYVWCDAIDGLGTIGYDDGDAYYGHFITVELDWKKGKAGGYISIDG